MRSFFHSVAFAPALVAALNWDGAVPTPVDFELDPAVHGMSPAPTNAPQLSEVELELLKRQDDPDRTCGYISQDLSLAMTCGIGFVCATNSYNGVAGCCNPYSMTDCRIQTSCVPQTRLSSCGSDCLLNEMILKCSGISSSACYTMAFPFDTTTMTYYGCDYTPGVYTAYQSYTNFGGSGSSSRRITRSATDVAATVTAATATGTGTTTPRTGTASASTSTFGLTFVTSTPTPAKKSTPIGAIVGGVVGGLAVLGAVAFGIFFLCLRNKKKKNAASNQAALAAVQNNGGNPPPQQPQQPQMAQPQQFGTPYYPPQAEALPPKAEYYTTTQPTNGMMTPGAQPYSPGAQPYSPPVSPSPVPISPAAPAYAPPANYAEVPGAMPVKQAGPPPEGISEAPAGNVPRGPAQGGAVHELA